MNPTPPTYHKPKLINQGQDKKHENVRNLILIEYLMKSYPELGNIREQPLPEGWEARLDNKDRIFFMDHLNRHTQWEDPRIDKFLPR